MKSLKLVLIATIFVTALVSTANADGFKSKPMVFNVVNVNLEQAVQMPDLVSAIYQQIDGKVFLSYLRYPYLVEVYHQKSLYRIKATRKDWIRFFNRQRVEVNPNLNRGYGTD